MKAETIQKASAVVFFAALFPLFTLLGSFGTLLGSFGTLLGLLRRSDFLIPLGVLAIIGIVMLFRARPDQSRTVLIVIVALPVFWLLILAWGGIFFAGSIQPQKPLVQYPLEVAPWLYVVVAGLCVWRLPKARLLALTYSLLNLYFVLVSTFISGMSVTGIWL